MGKERKLRADPTNPNFTTPECNMWGIDLNSAGTNKVLKSAREFDAKINSLLTSSARPLPFAVEYCSEVLSNPNGNYIKNRTFHKTLTYLNEAASSENFSDECGFHVSVVVGQEWKDGACYAIIRNTWGEGNVRVKREALARNTLRYVIVGAHE
jgi:hypothetical protein